VPTDKIYPDEPRLFRYASGIEWTSDALRAVYEIIVEEWSAIGFTPDALMSYAPEVKGIGNGWGTYARKRKRLEQAGFEGVKALGLARMGEDCRLSNSIYLSTKDWLLLFYAQQRTGGFALGWIPTAPGFDPAWFDRAYARLIDVTSAVRGHESVFEHQYELWRYVSPLSPEFEEYERDAGDHWSSLRHGSGRDSLLKALARTIFVGESQLDAPMGRSGVTLREWIIQAPQERGTLSDFGSDRLLKWAIPADRFGEIREALFRGGRLYTYRFFHNPEGPYERRDLLEPWEWESETPERFRPEFLKTIREMRAEGKQKHLASREQIHERFAKLKRDQDDARQRYVEDALEKMPSRVSATPAERLEHITRFYGMEYVAHRRCARDPGVIIDLREIERLTGKALERTALNMIMHHGAQRFLGLSQEEIGQELLRYQESGQAPPAGSSSGQLMFTGVDARGITGFSWRPEPPIPPRTSICVTLDEFFDGNDDPRSIRAKKRRNVSVPSLEECERTLRALRENPEIDEALISVGAFPDPDEPDDDAMWFHADGVVVHTRATSLKELKDQLKPLGMYSFFNRKRNADLFERMPTLADDAHIHVARWWPRRDWRFAEDPSDL